MAEKVSTPQKTFDDQLERLVQHLKAAKLTLPGVDVKGLEADLKAQREEKQADMELLARYEATHQAFLVAQSERYARYMKAVKILRATNIDDPAGLKGLEQFKRPRGKKTPEAAPPAPVPPTPLPLPAPVAPAVAPSGAKKPRGR